MKKKSFTLFVIVFLVAIACTPKNETYKQLVQIDTLLLGHNMDDTAAILLRNVDPQTKEDTAYYNILLSAAEYDQNWKIKSLDPINYSIEYYTAHPDNLKLANAYYYKAIYYVALNKITEEVVVLLKKAEEYAENTNNTRLQNRIYSVLSIVNFTRGEYDEALKYSSKDCATAKKLRDNYCITYALMDRSIIYKALHNSDSSEYCIMQCKLLADNIEGEDKAFFYNYLGECFTQENPAAAKNYFLKALNYKKLSDAYANLAKIYYNENQIELAESYCDSALINPSIKIKNEVLALMAKKSYENGNIEKYKQATDKLTEALNYKMQHNEQSRVLELQKKYDFEKQHAEYQRKQWVLCTTIGILLGLCLLGAILHKLRLQKIKNRELELESANSLLYNEITDLNNRIANCKNRINELNNEKPQLLEQNQIYKKKIAELNTQLDNLNSQMIVYMENGQRIYRLMEQGKSIAQHADSWADCVYYFTIKNPEYYSILGKYKNLTINDKIFIILEKYLKMSDDDMAIVFSVSIVTVRTHRHKLKQKEIQESWQVLRV